MHPTRSQAPRRHGRVALTPPWENARNIRRNERPVRGDNRTGQAVWALGVDGRSRRIQPRWGGITAPTSILSQQHRRTFNAPACFFNFLAGTFGRELPDQGFFGDRRIGDYCAPGRRASPAAGLSGDGVSDAMVAEGTFNARVTSSRPRTFS